MRRRGRLCVSSMRSTSHRRRSASCPSCALAGGGPLCGRLGTRPASSEFRLRGRLPPVCPRGEGRTLEPGCVRAGPPSAETPSVAKRCLGSIVLLYRFPAPRRTARARLLEDVRPFTRGRPTGLVGPREKRPGRRCLTRPARRSFHPKHGSPRGEAARAVRARSVEPPPQRRCPAHSLVSSFACFLCSGLVCWRSLKEAKP